MQKELRHYEGEGSVPVSFAGLALKVAGKVHQPETGPGAGDPALVVECRQIEDAITCIRFACEHGLLLTLHNGTSGPRQWTDCEGGIAVDLSPLVREEARTTGPVPSG